MIKKLHYYKTQGRPKPRFEKFTFTLIIINENKNDIEVIQGVFWIESLGKIILTAHMPCLLTHALETSVVPGYNFELNLVFRLLVFMSNK